MRTTVFPSRNDIAALPDAHVMGAHEMGYHKPEFQAGRGLVVRWEAVMSRPCVTTKRYRWVPKVVVLRHVCSGAAPSFHCAV